MGVEERVEGSSFDKDLPCYVQCLDIANLWVHMIEIWGCIPHGIVDESCIYEINFVTKLRRAFFSEKHKNKKWEVEKLDAGQNLMKKKQQENQRTSCQQFLWQQGCTHQWQLATSSLLAVVPLHSHLLNHQGDWDESFEDVFLYLGQYHKFLGFERFLSGLFEIGQR